VLSVLERAESLTERPDHVLAMRARTQAAAGDEEGMRETMERVRSRAGGRARPLAVAWIAQGQLEHSLGNDGAALAAYMRAHGLDPDSPGLAHAAGLAERTGDLGRALRAYGQLCREAGEASPHSASRARVERRLTESPPLPRQPPPTP
jgi:hypothetical protein